MLFNRASMLNRRASQSKFKAKEIMRYLPLQKGQVAADIGSGGGYFTMLLAEKVGLDGKVFAVDTKQELLDYIKENAEENQMTNVETVVVDEKGLKLSEKSCDLIFLRNVFHHLDTPAEYFENLKTFLKPGGKVVIIDYKKCAAFNFITLMGHYVKEELIEDTLKKAGYVHIEKYGFLSEQSFNIFQLK